LEVIAGAEAVWMIEDNVDADIVGAESVGIPAILVRKRREGVKRFFEDLSEIPAIVEG
jgi:FMN phosphatase YigB (HAD superfamily)